MEGFDRIGVFLSNSPADDEALAYAGRLAARAASELRCVFVPETGDRRNEVPDAATWRAGVLRQLPPAVAERAIVELHEAAGIAEILKATAEAEIDLAVVGRRLPSEAQSRGPSWGKMIRKAPCSVLVAPSYARPRFERLLVPIDFSEHSRLALDAAVRLLRGGGAAAPELVLPAIYSVGYGYSKTGLTLDECERERSERIQSELRDLLAQSRVEQIAVRTLAIDSENTAAVLIEVGVATQADLIVIGSRGSGGARRLWMGSTAEQIVEHAPLPVLVVKRRGETRSLLDSLLG